MPVFVLKASRTFWNDSCSLPPHRDVTVIVAPAAAPLPPGAAEPPPPHAETMMTAAIGSVRNRGNLAIGLLLLLAGERSGGWPVLRSGTNPVDSSAHTPARVLDPAAPGWWSTLA